MRIYGIFAFIFGPLILTGCASSGIFASSEEINRRFDERAQRKTDNENREIESQITNETREKDFWIKGPYAAKKCKYDSAEIKPFSKVRIKDAKVTGPLVDRKIQLIVETEKGTQVSIPYDNFYWQTDDSMEECFFPFNPRKKVKMSQADWNLVLAGKVRWGFTRDQVILAIGDPSTKNVTENAMNRQEQWVYRDKQLYLYFNDGKLTTIQK